MQIKILLLTVLAVLALVGCNDDSPSRSSGNSTSPTPHQGPIVSAHRGGAAYAPENTLLAMENAMRLGVDQLEADTQLTADGVLILIHDDTLDRTTDCNGVIIDLSYAELADCDAAYWFSPGQRVTRPDEEAAHPLRGTGIGIPQTESLIQQLAALGEGAPELSIEIKDVPGETNFDPVGAEVANVLVPLIQQYSLQSKVIVQSFWPAAIDQVKLLDPSIRTQLLTTSEIGVLATEGLSYATLRGHDIVAPDHKAPDLSSEYVQAAHGAGKQVFPWTADQPADIQRLIELGVDGIITNYPACMLALQGRRGSGPNTPAGVTPVDDCPE